jgi:hypothetical protein
MAVTSRITSARRNGLRTKARQYACGRLFPDRADDYAGISRCVSVFRIAWRKSAPGPICVVFHRPVVLSFFVSSSKIQARPGVCWYRVTRCAI